MSKIKLAGCQHLEGVSKKTGRPYNFNQIYFLAPKSGVKGLFAYQVNLDPDEFPLERLEPGQYYNVEQDFSGGIVALEKVV